MNRIGMVGLGVMGAGIAGNLLAKGFALSVHARRTQQAQPWVERGAALADTPAAMGQVVNVGTGVEVMVRDVAQQAAHLAGSSALLKIGAIASRPGEASRYVCAIDKMQALTGWRPTTDLTQGLTRTLQWWRGQPGAR